MIGLIAVTGSGRAAAARLAASWPGQTRSYDGPTRPALARAWAQCDGLVCFLAVGATVRLIAPLLDSKWTDPAVVCLDESARHAVAVVGGHAAGANALAARVAEVFGAVPVITTATDAVSLPGLDLLGWPTEGAIGTVSRALLDGERVRLESDRTWPLPPLPDTVGDSGECAIVITDRITAGGPRTAILRPPSLVIGVGVTGEAGAHEVLRLADAALAEAGLCAASVTAMATAGVGPAGGAGPGGGRGGEQLQEVRAAARERGWPLLTVPAGRPAAASIGGDGNGRGAGSADGRATAAVALAGAGEVVLPARTSGPASVAIARLRPRGRLALVGTGPGARDLLTPRATRELRRASVLVGLGQALEHVADLVRAGTRVLASPPGEEIASIQLAVAQAQLGLAVAVALPAEPGMEALASLARDLAKEDIDLVEVPGVAG